MLEKGSPVTFLLLRRKQKQLGCVQFAPVTPQNKGEANSSGMIFKVVPDLLRAGSGQCECRPLAENFSL